MKPQWAVGLMTGTVLDGNIDVALIRSDGERVEEFGPYELLPYPTHINGMLQEALSAALDWNFQGPEPEIFARAEAALTEAQSHAVVQVIDKAGFRPQDIGVIGFHGQTVLHRAPVRGRIGATRQLGDGALMARITGVDVVYDFRSADIAAGGQGAPLSAIYHAALLEGIETSDNAAVLNLGGIGNITWRGKDGVVAAFDTGPANAPINDFIHSRGMGRMDRDGALARKGRVDEALLTRRLSSLPYLVQPYPKSLDRFDFGYDWVSGLSTEDGAATLTAFSAAAVGAGLDILPQRPDCLIVTGGGRHNPALMAELAARADIKVDPAEAAGWRGDAIEAECFAFLALRSLRGLPQSFPTTTGVAGPIPGGRIARHRPTNTPD
ncbi:MAG: anhydro-N-acetylmuramic acid kinase [Pseudorhodobacter sp.]